VAAICLAVVLELAGLPSLGNDLKMIAIYKRRWWSSLEAALR